jgi:hypothetical protein
MSGSRRARLHLCTAGLIAARDSFAQHTVSVLVGGHRSRRSGFLGCKKELLTHLDEGGVHTVRCLRIIELIRGGLAEDIIVLSDKRTIGAVSNTWCHVGPGGGHLAQGQSIIGSFRNKSRTAASVLED